MSNRLYHKTLCNVLHIFWEAQLGEYAAADYILFGSPNCYDIYWRYPAQSTPYFVDEFHKANTYIWRCTHFIA